MADETRPLLNESASAPRELPEMPPLYYSALSFGARSTYGEPGKYSRSMMAACTGLAEHNECMSFLVPKVLTKF